MEVTDFYVVAANKRLRVQQLKVHKRRNEPTLVFLHEGLGCVEFWKDFPKEIVMATGLNAVVYDRQGYGQSDAFTDVRGKDYLEVEAFKYLPDLLRQLNIQWPILVGHSDGGTIALLYASRYPSKAVVSLAAHVLVEEVTTIGIKEVVHQYHNSKMPERLERYHGEKTAVVFSAWADTWLADWFANWDVRSYLEGVQAPVLLLQGEEDIYATPEHLNFIADKLSGNVETVLVPDCGHSPHIENKTETFRWVADFINTNKL